MKLVTYQYVGQIRLGALLNEQIVDLNRAYKRFTNASNSSALIKRADALVPSEIVPFLEGGTESMEAARKALNFIEESRNIEELSKEGVLVPLKGATLLAPVPRPPKLLAVWVNYDEHGNEASIDAPKGAPLFFSKLITAVTGPYQPIILPKISQKVDYEAELALVIGKRGKNISADKAYEYVAGYTIMNDVSARDFSLKALIGVVGPSMVQKSFDTFAPMGPCLVTSDEIPDPHNLNISLRIDNETLQDSNTRYMIHRIPKLIEYISAIATLEPGDVITTGTPPGVGFARNPPRWMKAGETVRIEVEKIGTLENPLIDEER
jgi:acylpyruvate hydrolase